jgi:SAM-dependent methyltransferase
LGRIVREFLRDSLPDRKRERFGDADYDWDYRVDTTSANVGWRARLIGFFNSAYQPIEAEIFREMVNRLAIDFCQFIFIDIGSGKGRALLLASEYPFRRIIGVELLPELNRIAQENIRAFSTSCEREVPVESLCGDATEFEFPDELLVVYFFHPLTEAGFRRVISNLQASLAAHPREIHIIYANPIFELILAADRKFRKTSGTHQYSIFQTIPRTS